MYRLLDAHRRSQADRSAGFTLIEVIVALGLLVLVTAAIYPQVVAGLRATGVARDITQAKGVAQARLEQMRAMPYYVGREAGDYIDILDTYYRNTVAPSTSPVCASSPLPSLPATSWSGYVAPTAPHCAWEPAGPLYRKVINPIQSPGLGAFAMVVSTQFLAGATPPTPTPPLAGYDSQVAGFDAPAASQIGVTIAVFYRTQSGVRYTTTYSQIERGTPMDPLVQSKAKATTVHVSSFARTWATWNPGDPDPAETTNDQATLLADIGIVNLTGELFTGSRVLANATGAAAATSLPSAVTGATTHLVAPTDTPPTGTASGSVQLPNGCKWVCFGATQTRQVSATASDGLPNAGTPTAPVTALIPAGATRNGFWFDNGKWRNRLQLAPGEPMVSLDTAAGVAASLPGVRDCEVGATGAVMSNAFLSATGFLTTTPASSADPEVTACGTAQADTIRVFPTTFAPGGVIRVGLARASAYCTVHSKAATSATADYQATVQYWNGSGYSTVPPIRAGNTTDPLDAVNLAQVVDPGSGLTLGDYIQSWSSLTDGEVVTRQSARSAEVDVPGVVTLFTGPTRSFASGWGASNTDAASALSLSVGAVSCQAGDYR